jgi:aquaporin Z
VAEIELRRGIAPDDGEAKSVRLVARTSAFVFEVVGTFPFLVTILGVAPKGFGGLAIGLTLVVIHLVGINITGTSVNPARSIGPALIGMNSNAGAVAQLWLFIIAPLIGAGLAGVLYREGALLDAPTEG